MGASFPLAAFALLAGCSGEAADEELGTGGAAAAGSTSVSAGGNVGAGGNAGAGGSVNQAGSGSAVGQGGAGSAGMSSTATGGVASMAGAGQGGNASAGSTAGSGATGGSTAAPQGCSGEAQLRRYAPTDKEELKLFNKYLTSEVATLACDAGGGGGSRTITNTIFVAPGAVYDGKGEKIKADAGPMKCDTTEGEQGESQRPYFLLAPGATLKNVTIEYPGCDGIHMMGDNVLENVTWSNVGEDAASVRSYFPGGKILIKASKASTAQDKMFQFNAKSDVRIENFTGTGMGKLVRQNGGTTFELHIDLNNVKVTGVVSAVVQSDSPTCFVRHHALSYEFNGSGDKSDRVFRDLPPANVTQY